MESVSAVMESDESAAADVATNVVSDVDCSTVNTDRCECEVSWREVVRCRTADVRTTRPPSVSHVSARLSISDICSSRTVYALSSVKARRADRVRILSVADSICADWV